MTTRTRLRGFLVLCILLGVSACTSVSKPNVIIVSPPSGSAFNEGDEIQVQSMASDAAGVTRVEMLVDNAVVKIDPSPTAQGQTTFNLVQTWKATQGAHTIIVRAYNTTGGVSDPVAIAVNVAQAAAPVTPTSVAVPPRASATPTRPAAPPAASPTTGGGPPSTNPTSTPVPPTEVACTDNSAYVADVTVPDGTNFNAGQTFTKTWRVSNNGTCAWENNFQFVFVNGEAMATTTVIQVPKTAVGASADLSVPMTAPAAPGLHTGQWKLRNASGSLFGQSVTVKINVTNPAPPAVSGCSGTPSIASFTASPTSIFVGGTATLNWGLVSNADSVEVDHGINGVATPGSVKVSPGSDTTYTLTAHCGANTSSKQVTIKVTPLAIITIPPIIFQLIKVTSVSVTGSSANPLVICPRSYTFTGTIKTNGATTVTGKWERDNGDGPAISVKFDAAGTKTVTYSYSATSSDSFGTVQLNITSPNKITSSTANYTCAKLIKP